MSNRQILAGDNIHSALAASILTLCTLPFVAHGQTEFSLTGATYSQNFDSMGNTALINALPSGWVFNSATTFSGGTTDTTRGAGTTGTNALNGSSAGGAYMFVNGVLATGTDKSIGYLTSSGFSDNRNIVFGLTNNTGTSITAFSLTFDYEKYRSGTATRDWTFFGSTDGTTWGSAIGDGAQSYAADANNTTVFNPPTSVSKSVSISGLNILAGQKYYFRWNYDGSGTGSNAQGLGLDNFGLAWTGGVVTYSYWDLNGSTTGLGFVNPGDTATWDTSTTNWTGTADGLGSPATYDSSKATFFEGNYGTVEIAASNVNADGGITFNSSDYIIAGAGKLILGGATPAITVTASSHTATVNAVVDGTAGLQKTGAGKLILGGSNLYTGATTISNGTLEISADANLGNATSGVAINGGTLKTTANITLNATRSVSGTTSTLDIAPGTTLAVPGSFNTTSLTLSNIGILDLQGTTRSVGNLTFTAAGTVTSTGVNSGAISTGTGTVTATNLTSGTATIAAPLDLGVATKSVDVGSGGTLELAGAVTLTGTGTASLRKTGAGTLRLSADNSATLYRVQIGSSSAGSPLNGGTVEITNKGALGQNQVFLNYGTLLTTTPLTGANAIPLGISFSGRSNGVPSLGGTQPIEFTGQNTLFASGVGVDVRLNVNNTTTLSGTWAAPSPANSVSSFTLGGTGRLIVSGDASGQVTPTTLQDSVNLEVRHNYGAGITVNSGAKLSGDQAAANAVSGTIAVSNGGTLAPGNLGGASFGTIRTTNLNLTSGAVFKLELDSGTLEVDKLVANGSVQLGGATLDLTDLGAVELTIGTTFTIIENSSTTTDATDGLFLGFQDGYDFVLGLNTFKLDYNTGATGNDVQLIVVPEPTSTLLLLGSLAPFLVRRRRAKMS